MTIQVCELHNGALLLTPHAKGLNLCDDHFNANFLQQNKLITNTAHGRGIVYFFTLGDKELVLRHYKRGGLVAKISNDKFIFTSIDNTRCYEELSVLQHLRDENVNVPRPIAGMVTRKGLFYKADIITERVPNTIELDEVLRNEAVSAITWQAIGVQIKKMHSAQVFHGDINVKNILLEKESVSPTVHILDFDKCEIKPGHDWKNANLMRFKRSLLKQTSKAADYNYGEQNWADLHDAYKNA